MSIVMQRWQDQAVCFVETGATPELWTPEHRPRRAVRVHLEGMCQRCPVRQECARNAVLMGEQAGMYAGVFVPERREPRWSAAMAELRVIAGISGEYSTLPALAVPA